MYIMYDKFCFDLRHCIHFSERFPYSSHFAVLRYMLVVTCLDRKTRKMNSKTVGSILIGLDAGRNNYILSQARREWLNKISDFIQLHCTAKRLGEVLSEQCSDQLFKIIHSETYTTPEPCLADRTIPTSAQ